MPIVRQSLFLFLEPCASIRRIYPCNETLENLSIDEKVFEYSLKEFRRREKELKNVVLQADLSPFNVQS